MDAAALSVFIRNFREAAPYIDYLRGKTLVVGIASGLLQPERFRSVAADLALETSAINSLTASDIIAAIPAAWRSIACTPA